MGVSASLTSACADLSSTLRLWRRTLALLLAAAPGHLAAVVALMALQAVLPIGTLVASRAVVNAAAGALGLPSGTATFPLALWITLAVLLLVVQQLLLPFLRTLQGELGDRLTAHVNGVLIAAANRWRGLARFEDPALADDLRLVREHAAGSAVGVIASGGALVQALFTIVAMGLAIARLQPALPLLLILASIPQALQENAFAQNMSNEYESSSPDARRLDSYRDALLGRGTAKDVRLFGLGAFFLGLHSKVYGQISADVWALRHRLLRRMLPAQALAGAVAAASYLYIVWRVVHGGASVGDLVYFGGALLQLEEGLGAAGFYVGFIGLYFTWLPALFRVLDAPPDMLSSSTPPLASSQRTSFHQIPSANALGDGRGGMPAPRPIRDGLVLERVSFRYPGASSDSLTDLSLRLLPGQRLALVGRNGAGKTTLVKLLCRLYDPTDGRILLDGVDLRDYDLADWRRQIGVIFQDFVQYQLTVRENVGLGDLAGLADLARVEQAAELGGAAALIGTLPQGYATKVGSEFGGVELSGGQWQKIALSRAFMRETQLLILDEPTAALDVQAEHDVYQRFSALTRDRTTVLVSHRFSTVRMAEHIAYLEAGRLVEEGAHEQLLALNGGYAHLYRLQAELYRDAD